MTLFLILCLAGCGSGPGVEQVAGDAGGRESAPSSDVSPVEEAARTVPVRVLELAPESVPVEAEWPGELRTARRASLAIEVAGVVDRRHVEEGERVEAGEALIEIDTRELEQRLAEAEAVDRQRAAQLERAKALLERRSITQAQYLDALTARDVAAARLAAARLALEKSTLRAPWSGRIASLHVEVGDFISPGAVALELLDERLEMWAPVPASDAPHLEIGQPAEVRLDAFPAEVFAARLVRLGAELDAASRTLDVVASVENPSKSLRPGFTGRLRVELRRLEGALLVPLDAVVELADEHAVYVVSQGRAVQRPVRTGVVIGTDRVVTEGGLAAGDRVIVRGQRQVSPEQPVGVEPGDV